MVINLEADVAIIGHARNPVSKQAILAITPISMIVTTSRLRIPPMQPPEKFWRWLTNRLSSIAIERDQ